MALMNVRESGRGRSLATSRTAASLASIPESCIIIVPPLINSSDPCQCQQNSALSAALATSLLSQCFVRETDLLCFPCRGINWRKYAALSTSSDPVLFRLQSRQSSASLGFRAERAEWTRPTNQHIMESKLETERRTGEERRKSHSTVKLTGKVLYCTVSGFLSGTSKRPDGVTDGL